MSYLFVFSYCSWGSQGKNTEVSCHCPVDHVLSELSTMTHLSWVALYSMAHSFIELDKAVVHVIRLVSFSDSFHSVCPLLEKDKRIKAISSSALSLLYGPTLTSIYDYWKNHSFEYRDVSRPDSPTMAREQ